MSAPAPHFTLSDFEFFTHPVRTRFPFRYGIASLTVSPHLFVRVRVQLAAAAGPGMASECLPPEWFHQGSRHRSGG
ncbi:MAG: hypothetical protein U1F77_10310 [Kiritimatiellia bacterium]